MLATLIGAFTAAVLAVCVRFVPGFEAELMFPQTLFEFFFGISLFSSSLPWLWTLFLSLGAETSPLSASALRSNIDDRKMVFYSAGMVLVSLVGIVVISQPLIPMVWCFALAVVCAGIVLDLLRMAYFRLCYRRSPEGIAEWSIETMQTAIRKRDERHHTISFEMVFSLIVAYMKKGEFGALRLFCQKIVSASDLWLGSIARLSLFRIPADNEETLLDRYMLAEAMTAKRLAWVVKEACDTGSTMALEEVVRFVGKLFMAFHAHHESLGFLLLLTLSQVTQKTEGKIEAWDRNVEVLSAFSEVIKALVDRCVDRGISDKASILKVLSILETRVKETFRREKAINPAFLMQPFAEIGQMLANSRYSNFPDRDAIVADLRRILAQFAALEGVTSRLDVGGGDTDTRASFHEDLPFTTPRRGDESTTLA